jgi:hypothetical protein
MPLMRRGLGSPTVRSRTAEGPSILQPSFDDASTIPRLTGIENCKDLGENPRQGSSILLQQQLYSPELKNASKNGNKVRIKCEAYNK